MKGKWKIQFCRMKFFLKKKNCWRVLIKKKYWLNRHSIKLIIWRKFCWSKNNLPKYCYQSIPGSSMAFDLLFGDLFQIIWFNRMQNDIFFKWKLHLMRNVVFLFCFISILPNTIQTYSISNWHNYDFFFKLSVFFCSFRFDLIWMVYLFQMELFVSLVFEVK